MGELCGAGVITRARRASSSPSARGKPRRERNDERKPRSYGHPGREMMASPETWEPIRCVERLVHGESRLKECGCTRVRRPKSPHGRRADGKSRDLGTHQNAKAQRPTSNCWERSCTDTAPRKVRGRERWGKKERKKEREVPEGLRSLECPCTQL